MKHRGLPFLFCWLYLGFLAAAAVLADWLAPYHFQTENRNHSFHPPTRIHFVNRQGKFSLAPFVYRTQGTHDTNLRRIYLEDDSERFYLRFLGRRFVSVAEPARLYLWGTDSRGRDLFSRILYGARISLSVGLIGSFVALLIGLAAGGLAGYFGGARDDFLMRLAEFFIMIPSFYLLLALRSVLPMRLGSTDVYVLVVVILSLVGWGGMARVIRGMVISIRDRDFVLAAKVLGRPDSEILVRHVLPQTVAYLAVVLSTSIPGYVLAESALSLLGLGIQEPAVSWGNLLTESLAIAHWELHPWIIAPGIVITATAFCFNALGDYYANQ